MKQRKQYVIDKKFQKKMAFSIISIVILITAIINLGIAVNMFVNNGNMNKHNTVLEKNTINIENILELQDNIVHFLTSKNLATEDKIFKAAMKDVSRNHIQNMKNLGKIMKDNKDVIKSNKGIVTSNYIMLSIILAVMIMGNIVLYILLIRKTHKISGPIYVMTMYLKEALSGNYPEMRALREKDELKDFYELLGKVIKKSKGTS